MIEIAIKIGYIVIAALVAANLYFVIRILDIKYDLLSVFDRFKKEENDENITWNQK